MFGKKGVIDSGIKESGTVGARIEIKKIDRNTREVKAFIFDCSNGNNVYKATFTTQASTDFYAYNVASEDLKRVIEREGYVLDGGISTNVSLPYVKTSRKRTR